MDQLFDNVHFLSIIKILLFVAMYVTATSYLLPKGITALVEWKKKGDIKSLGVGINYSVGGLFLVIYLITKFITTSGL